MNDLKIVKGNEFATLVKVRAFKYDGTEVLNFNFRNVTNLYVAAHVNAKIKIINPPDYQILDGNILKIKWTDHEQIGLYALEVRGEYNKLKWRFFDKEPIFTIVNTNAEANIPPQSIIDEDTYRIIAQDVKLWDASCENKIDYVEVDNYVYKWDSNLGTYVKSNIYVKGDDGDSAYQVAVRNGFIGTEQEWLDPLVMKDYSKIHVGDFNSGNDCDEQGWYDSVSYGRPERSESDEKYILYTSSNGSQICWSKRNSGKSYHRISKNHPWIALTHDDYGLLQSSSSAIRHYVLDRTIDPSSVDGKTGIDYGIGEVYAGYWEIEVPTFDLVIPITDLEAGSIIKVRTFFRHGEGSANEDAYNSDAYIYLSNSEEKGHEASKLMSDFIKVKSLGSLGYPFSGENENLQWVRNNIFTSNSSYGEHTIKCNNSTKGTYYLHIAGDFTIIRSWLVFDTIEIYKPITTSVEADIRSLCSAILDCYGGVFQCTGRNAEGVLLFNYTSPEAVI